MDVQQHGLGDWWSDWQGSACPALPLHGQRSSDSRLPLDALGLSLSRTNARKRTIGL
jgi:hypothetical protein